MTSISTVVLALQWCLLLFLEAQLLDATAVSDRKTLGGPRIYDCLALYDKLPFAMDPPHGALVGPRLFLEPQYLPQPFSYVRNTYPQASMIQLPRMWRLNTCRIALMSFPDRTGVVRNPMSVSTWSIVLKEILDAINLCVRRRHQGAIGFINNKHGTTLMMAYVYARDSKFEAVLNVYMSSYRPVDPWDILATAGMSNSTSATF